MSSKFYLHESENTTQKKQAPFTYITLSFRHFCTIFSILQKLIFLNDNTSCLLTEPYLTRKQLKNEFEDN